MSTVLDLRSPWPRPIAPGTQLARFEGATRVFIAGIVVASFALPVLFNNLGQWTPRALIFWVCLGVGLALYVFPEHPRYGVVLVLAVCCYSPHSGFDAGSNWYSWSLSVGFLILGTEFKTTAIMWLYSGYLVALIASAHAAYGGPAARYLVDLVPLHLALAYVTSRCLAMFLSGIGRLDAERSGRTVTIIAQDLALHEVAATREAQRILHDRVLTTLTRVAELGSLDRESLRRTVRELSNPLGSPPASGASDEVPLDVVIHQAVEGSGVSVLDSLPADAHRWPWLGPDEAVSVERALEEVVRNADRHGAGMAALTAQHAAGRFTVQVSNVLGGRSDSSGGWGWNNSVRDVMRSIGGSSTLRIRDGRGVAELSWPHAADHEPAEPARRADAAYRATVEALGVDMGELLSLMWWILAGHTVLALLYSSRDGWMVLQLLVAVVIWLVGANVYATLTKGPPSLARMVAWHAVLLVAVALSLWQAGPESLRVLESWAIGMATVPTALAALFGTVRRALLAVPLIALVTTLAVVTPTVGPAGAMGAIWVTVVIPGAGFLLGVLIRRAGRRTASAEASARFRARQAYARWAASRTDGAVLTSTRDLVLPFLTDLDRGRIEADSPRVRATARRLAYRARDELNAPGLLDAALRDRIELARERGVTVTLEAPAVVDREQASVVLRLLDRLLDRVGQGDRVIVQVGGGGQGAHLTVISPRSGELTAGLTALTGSLAAEDFPDEYGTTITIPSASIPATPVEEPSSATS